LAVRGPKNLFLSKTEPGQAYAEAWPSIIEEKLKSKPLIIYLLTCHTL